MLQSGAAEEIEAVEQSLIDRFCASPHAAPITAAALDAPSGAMITADEAGTVAITRPGDAWPSILFDMGASVHGAAAACPGGSMVAVGDDLGTVAVYKTWDGQCAFEDTKPGAGGPARAMRALAFHPQGTRLASVSIDGIVRVWDIARWERLVNFQGYGGEAIEFDRRGERLLVIDHQGQPKLLDLATQLQVDVEAVPGGAKVARFTPDGQHIVAMGEAGLTLIGLPDGRIRTSFSARGSSGMLMVVMSPLGDAVAAVTGRSVHTFSLPELQPGQSESHGAARPTGAAVWDARGVAVGAADGQLHRPGARPSLPAVTCCTRFGDRRVAAHGKQVAVWEGPRQRPPFDAGKAYVEVKIDREGRLLVALPDDGSGVQVHDASSGELLFDAGPSTADTPKMEVGGTIVACMSGAVGLRWFDLEANNVFELPWVHTFALSGSGTWLAVVSPRGHVRILDPRDGEEVVDKPEPGRRDVPARLLTFVNRRPELLVMDAEGVLSLYDLGRAATQRGPATPRDVLSLNVDVDRLWGLTGGRHAAVRFQVPGIDGGPDTASVIYVDLHSGEVVSEVKNLLPYAWVDPETGDIVQPARGAAILEQDMHGHDKRVLRALPEGEWVSFGPEGVLARSGGAQL